MSGAKVRAGELPPEVLSPLAEGDHDTAGHELLVWGERLARSDPGAARDWVLHAEKSPSQAKVFGAFIHWTAGVVLHLTGNPDEAATRLQTSARCFDRLGHQALADRARLLLVDVYGEGLETSRARRLARRLEGRFAERGDRQRAAVAIANLACAEDAADRIERAERLWRRALQSLDPGGLRHLLTRANLANISAVRGRFDRACQEHRVIAAEARGRGLKALAMQAEMNLGETEFAAGQLDEALQRWHRVLGQARESGFELLELSTELELAEAELNMGLFHDARSRLDRSIPRLEKSGLHTDLSRAGRLAAVAAAAAGEQATWSRFKREYAATATQIQQDLAIVDIVQLDPSCSAEDVISAARRLLKEGLSHRGRLALAWAARRMIDRGDARRAKTIAREVLDSRHVSDWARLVAHHVLGKAGGPGSSRHLFWAVRYADRLHGRLASPADREAFLRIRGDVYLDLLGVLLERNRSADRRRAFDVLARLRSGWLEDALAQRSDRSGDPEIRRWQELRRRLAALLHQTEGDAEGRIRRSGLHLAEELRQVEHELSGTESALARRWPVLHVAGPSKDLASALLDRLPPGQCCIEYFLDDRDLVMFILFEGRLRVIRRAGIARQVEELCASAAFHLDAFTWIERRHGSQTRQALEATLAGLGRILLAGIPEQAKEMVWIAPHGLLYQLPWPALTADDGHSLIDRSPFTLIPGAETLLSVLDAVPVAPRSLAVIGAPSENLPQVERELEALSDICREIAPTAAVLGASRQEFLRMLESSDVVHLAGHAVFLDGLPAASGLRLADGFVTVHDLAATRLQARLVSFGVCSGLRLGGSGFTHHEGFLRALLAGGARTVVGPVAPVDDQTAFDFDHGFYRELASSGDPGDAYRRAICHLRDCEPHPAAWGAFHFFGDPRPWSDS